MTKQELETLIPGNKIVAAAIVQYGQIYSLPAPARHHDVISYISRNVSGFRDENGKILKPVNGIQGFIDLFGNFLTREEAAIITLRTGQIEKLEYSKDKLFSEDLF